MTISSVNTTGAGWAWDPSNTRKTFSHHPFNAFLERTLLQLFSYQRQKVSTT